MPNESDLGSPCRLQCIGYGRQRHDDPPPAVLRRLKLPPRAMRAAGATCLAGLAAISGSQAAQPESTAAQSKVDPCGERFDKVVTRNRFGRLELAYDGEHRSGQRKRYQLTCAPSTGYVNLMDLSEPSLLGASVSLNGRYVGYVHEGCENDDGPACQTTVTVQGVLGQEENRGPFSVARDLDDVGFLDVPSLRVTSKGGLVFAVCEPRRFKRVGRVRPECKRPGRPGVRIYGYPSDSDQRRTLDQGRRIDPDSIRRRGDVIYWQHGQQRRSVELP